MYETVLVLHSWMRAALALGALLLVLLSLRALFAGKQQSVVESGLLRGATILADVQLLFGLGLYFVWSPVTQSARADFGAAMKDPTLRYWAVEHPAAMLLVVALVHVGKLLAARRSPGSPRATITLIFFGGVLAVLAVMSSWPWSAVERPWLRLPAG